MNKRILSLVLALVMVLGAFTVVSAADVKVENMSQQNKIQWLVDNKIVEGHKLNAKDDKVDLDLEGTLTREQATKLIIHVIGKYDLAKVLQGVMKPFPDVDVDRWSNGVISVARTEKGKNGQPIVIGYEDGMFKPEKDVTYAELAKMLVTIVKDNLTDKMVKEAVWATTWMRWADEEGILKGLTIANSDKSISRRDAFEMIYNAKFALGETRYNKVSFGDKMGIVSKLQAGKVEINQDPSMTYNLTYNTILTDGTSFNSLARNNARPGSLVRLVTDKDNNVLYMIELGNYVDGALHNVANPIVEKHINNRWATVADYTVSSMGANKAKFVGTDRIRFHEGTEVNVMRDTRFFVADPANNFLKEVKSMTEAMKYYGKYDPNTNTWANTELKDVYAGFNKTAWGKEAKVIVFNTTHKFNGVSKLLRVYTDGVNSLHNVTLQETNGNLVTANTANYFPQNWFPGNWTFDHMDVVAFKTVKEGNNVYTRPTVKIDFSKDNVYEVTKMDRADRTIELMDKYNRKAKFVVVPSVDEFLERETRVGAHVQISLDAGKIDVISNVNIALRGALANGVNESLAVRGRIERIYKTANGDGYVAIARELANDVYGEVLTYRIPDTQVYSELENLEKANLKLVKLYLSKNQHGYDTQVVINFEQLEIPATPLEDAVNPEKVLEDFYKVVDKQVDILNNKNEVKGKVAFEFDANYPKVARMVINGGKGSDANTLVTAAQENLNALFAAGLKDYTIGKTQLTEKSSVDEIAKAILAALGEIKPEDKMAEVVVNFNLMKNGVNVPASVTITVVDAR